MKQKRLNRSLRSAIWDGSFFSIMQSVADTFFIPFALALNASNVQIGLVRAVPQLLGSFSQLIAVKLVDTVKRRKKIILTFVFLQALMWLPLLALTFFFRNSVYSVPALIVLITLFAAFGNMVTPAWWSLIGELVPEEMRGRYFGLRNKISGIFGIVSVLTAGYLLDIFSKTNVFVGFALLFAVAFISRMISLSFLGRMQEKEYFVDGESQFSFGAFVKKLRYTNFGVFAIFSTMMMFAVNFAGPFFSVYMLKELKFSYALFTAVSMAQSVVYFLFMPYWGRITDRYGNKHIMTICGFLIPVVPILWILNPNPYYLFAIQIFSGFVWAGFDLSTANFIFDAVSPQKRARVVGFYNVLLGSAIFLGASLGGLSATYLTPILLLGSIKTIFLISAGLRFLVAAVFLAKIKEARAKINVPERKLFREVVFVKPFKTIIHGANHDISWAMDHVRMAEKKAEWLLRK